MISNKIARALFVAGLIAGLASVILELNTRPGSSLDIPIVLLLVVGVALIGLAMIIWSKLENKPNGPFMAHYKKH